VAEVVRTEWALSGLTCVRCGHPTGILSVDLPVYQEALRPEGSHEIVVSEGDLLPVEIRCANPACDHSVRFGKEPPKLERMDVPLTDS
jgi:hypothetical protein